MTSARSLLLACTALTAAAGLALPASQAHAASANLIMAQAQPAPPDKEKQEEKKPQGPAAKPPAPHGPPPAAQRPAAPPPAAPHPAAPPAAQRPAAPPPPAAPHPEPPKPPAAQRPSAPPPPAAQHPEAPKPPAAQRPSAPPPPAAQHSPAPKPPAPPAAETKPAAPPPAALTKPSTPPTAETKPSTPPAAETKSNTPPPPAAGERRPGAPPSAERRPGAAPAAQSRPGTPPAPAAQGGQPSAPTAQTPPSNQPPNTIAGRAAVQAGTPAAAAPPPPTQPRSASDFIRRDNNKGPERGMDDLRRERREVREGDRTIITEGDRTIVRDGDRRFIRHNEADRFAIDARDVRVSRRGEDTVSIIVRPDGSQIITTTDRYGRLLRRVRRDNGREVVIIDNRYTGPRQNFFVDVPPPRWRGPEDRYILDADNASRDSIYTIFEAPPIQRLDRRYTLEEVRYSEPLRAYMPRVDLDVHFDTGSWQLTPDQINRLAEIADGIKRAVSRNSKEVFLIEGHTDAVGTQEDNLSLSDRRAEAVAVALTEQFQVPPENLVTQGYGEEYLKVKTEGPSRENRRVAVRRITPLIDQQAGR